MLDPEPAFADAVKDHLPTGAVGDVGGCQVDHQQPTVGIHGDVALAADNLLASIVTPCLGGRRLDALAVDHAAGGARIAAQSYRSSITLRS